METLAGLWLPIVVSSVLVFVASSLIWNVLGAHKWHIRGLPDEAAAREALAKQSIAPGMYTIPYSPSRHEGPHLPGEARARARWSC